jgi:hypothetical protein
MKNPWSGRWSFVKDYIPNGVSIIDFGCGNKEVLDHTVPSNYLGVDLLPTADLVADLNYPLEISGQFDIALLLGVLEYVTNPDLTLSYISHYADKFVVLSLAVKKKNEWVRAFTDLSIDQLLRRHFNQVKHYQHDGYILSVCKK